MAEIVVGAVVTVLIEKLLTGELIKFARSEGIDSQLIKWRKKLPLIQAVLADAGQKEITQKAVQLWLLELQNLAYDIDDVLDDIATEVLKRKLNKEESHATTSKVMKIIPACFTNFTPHDFMYGREISSKLDEITTTLNDLYQQRKDLGLDVNVEKSSSRKNKPLEETSLVDESKILGREGDKQALLEKLLGVEASNEHDVKIVSIVGLGGVGKTTLARVLYNNEQVKGHFPVRAWVCVSDEFDVFEISKAIYQAVCGENKEFTNLDLLHVALKEKLSNQKFLLVLDDVWNECHTKWEVLQRPFVGASECKVIVTTRSTTVASVMNSVPYKLGILSDDTALSLLAQYALQEQNFDNHPLLRSIAQDIGKKCDGLPLALLTLGRVLKTKGINDDEWRKLLNSEIWSSKDGSDTLPALKLSYYHLPSHLKQVFAYCSMFPKGYDFEKDKLILLWMAQGFLSQGKDKNQPKESLGRTYFEELVARSFFEPLGNDESRYKMHDLINDLATSVAGEFFFRLDKNMDLNGNEAYEKFRHFSFIRQQRVANDKKLEELKRTRCLRTFLLVSGGWGSLDNNITSALTLDNITAELVPSLHLLRVLSLTNDSITKVPQSIGNLKHLRYLNFSRTKILQIPEEVSKLYNLQSLLVRGCRNLSSLPTSFVKLINLRHLDISDTRSLKKLPLGIGELTSLQTLSKVVVQDNSGFKISELKGLKYLQGELSIEGLEKVIDPTEARDADLQQKKGIDDLKLVWGSSTTNEHDEHDVIEKLRPHSKLKTLCLNGYRGMKFPSWLGDPSFDRLTELELTECNCTELPTLEHLTSLRKLGIYRCSKLKSMEGEKEVVNVGSSIMRSLRQVIVHNCDALESYCCPSNVESLVIWSCDSMKSLSFSKLHAKDLPSSSSSSSLSSSNLKNLEVKDCKNIKSLSQEHLQSLTSLEEMFILTCPSMEDSFPSRGLWPPNLRILRIGEMKKPMSGWGFQNYPSSLVKLVLFGRNSGVVSFEIMEEQDNNNNNTTSSSCFLLPRSLTSLSIYNFEDVESVSKVLFELLHLEQLDIIECPKLQLSSTPSPSLRVYVS